MTPLWHSLMVKMQNFKENEIPKDRLNLVRTGLAGKESRAFDVNGRQHHAKDFKGLFAWLKTGVKSRNESSLREALEEYIEELEQKPSGSIAEHEKTLISNVLKLRGMTAIDVMVPRADIIAIDLETPQEELMKLLAEQQVSRIPVYRESMDDVIGTIHIKDILTQMATGRSVKIRELVREVPIVSPAMPLLDLLLHMRQSRKHMALVVDEYGGIDGLVTIGDLIEAIVGELDDEFENEQPPEISVQTDGSLEADARFDVSDFEQQYGEFLSWDEREDVDTLGGLVFSIAGRVPARGEVLRHTASGMVFEVLDADPRRVKRIRIRNLPENFHSSGS